EKLRAVFRAYMDGQTFDEVTAATGCSRASVSAYCIRSELRFHCIHRFLGLARRICLTFTRPDAMESVRIS
ncbi:MAG TPA: hypothetical protein PKM73_19795, partial [Verrucomicrobiota bacterium]|nr:hypothetical protein [Verrucomicrobiota bacterium]HNU53184.1 hypothetical protein [Verrucomicrobiota bacterium]